MKEFAQSCRVNSVSRFPKMAILVERRACGAQFTGLTTSFELNVLRFPLSFLCQKERQTSERIGIAAVNILWNRANDVCRSQPYLCTGKTSLWHKISGQQATWRHALNSLRHIWWHTPAVFELVCLPWWGQLHFWNLIFIYYFFFFSAFVFVIV